MSKPDEYPDITVHVEKTYEIHLDEDSMARLVRMLERYHKDINDKLPVPSMVDFDLISLFRNARSYRA